MRLRLDCHAYARNDDMVGHPHPIFIFHMSFRGERSDRGNQGVSRTNQTNDVAKLRLEFLPLHELRATHRLSNVFSIRRKVTAVFSLYSHTLSGTVEASALLFQKP